MGMAMFQMYNNAYEFLKEGSGQPTKMNSLLVFLLKTVILTNYPSDDANGRPDRSYSSV